jgi:hypothetical protein
MGLFSRKPAPEPRIQSLAEMIVYALTNETTRGGWVWADNCIANERLGIGLSVPYRRADRIHLAIGRDGNAIPFTYRDQEKIARAISSWADWSDECRRTEAMLDFVEAFERVAAQAGEAGTAETTEIGSAEGEHAVPKGCDQNKSA